MNRQKKKFEMQDEADFVYSLSVEQRKFFYKLIKRYRSPTLTKTYRRLGDDEVIQRNDYHSSGIGPLKDVTHPLQIGSPVKSNSNGMTWWREI